MSWLTQILRNVGLGSVLDDIEAAEKNPTAATIGKAIEGAAAAAPAAVTEGARRHDAGFRSRNRGQPGRDQRGEQD